MPDQPIVPLPEHLKHCGCRHAASGAHRTDCGPARAYAEVPLHQRQDFEAGRRYQAIRWEFPLEVEVSLQFTVSVDPLRYIAQNRDAYEAFEMGPGREEWERPIEFITQQIIDNTDMVGLPFGGSGGVSEVDVAHPDLRFRPEWSAAMTKELHESLPPTPDPNQLTLLG